MNTFDRSKSVAQRDLLNGTSRRSLIVNLIRKTRKQLGYTQAKFGKKFDVKANTVSYWESGEKEAPYKVIEWCIRRAKRNMK